MSMNRHPIAQALVRLWHQLIPFRLFRDANYGSVEQRIANFRYNRLQREILPPFILRWMAIAAFLMAGLHILTDLVANTIEGSSIYLCVVTLCATTGIAFAFACVTIMLLGVCFIFLSRPER